MEVLTVPSEHAGLELDEFLCLAHPALGKGFWRSAVRAGRVKLDGMPVHPSARLREHQVVMLEISESELDRPESPRATAAEEPLSILYEDESLLAIDKPSGLAVEGERWARERRTVASALRALAAERNTNGADGAPEFAPRPVHRLDKDTSGVLLAAKDAETDRALRQAFEHGRIRKAYLALVEGEHPLPLGQFEEIDLPIGPDERRGGRMRIDHKDGKEARTRVSIERRFRGYTWLRCQPLTGRTHQIRVHLVETGFPLVVDPMYGRERQLLLSDLKSRYRKKPGQVEKPLLERLSLHALELGFEHRGRELVLRSELPADLERTLRQLEKHRSFASGGRRGARRSIGDRLPGDAAEEPAG